MMRPREEEEGSFAASPLFLRLSPAEVDTFVRHAKSRKLRKGETLFRQGEASMATFLIKSGRIKLFYLSAAGSQTLLRVLGPGEILAISTALGAPQYPATAVAERATEVLCLSGKAFEGLIREIPLLGVNALRILSRRIGELQDRFSELVAEKVERRLARTLLRLAEQTGKSQKQEVILDLEISRQDLAEMTGATLFSISRILNAWQKAGILTLGRLKILIREPRKLNRIAEGVD